MTNVGYAYPMSVATPTFRFESFVARYVLFKIQIIIK